MKKSNIAFSGVMAAILFSAGAANATTTQIASKQYVDTRETAILENVSNTYETKENVQNLTEQVTNLGDTINNAETGLTTTVKKITQVVGDDTSGLVKDVTDLGTTVDGLTETVGNLDTELDSKLDSATADGKYEVLTNKATAINAENQTSGTSYPSVGAIVQWTNQKIADLSDTGLPVNPGNIEDGTISGSKLENGAVSTDKIANDAVTSDKIADDAVGSEHIQTGAVGTDEIADGAVGNADLAADSVTTDKIKDGTISSADLDKALNAKIDGKEDKSNKAVAIDSTNQASTDAYPSVKAVYDWTTQQIANVEFDPSELAPGSINGDAIQDGTITSDQIADGTVGTGDIADGAVTGDKLDETLAGQIADIGGKQDIAMGVGHENHIVTTDASGNITSAATIGQDKVTGLTTALADKASIDDIPTTVAELTDASNYATTTALTSGLAAKENASNKINSITGENESSDTYFPTVGAMTSWVSSEISGLSELPVNPDLIDDGTLPGSKLQSGAITADKIADGAVTTPKIADNAVTEDKLSDELNTEIDGKANAADVYTKLETDGKIVELAVPQPDADCQAESGLCVLSVTTSGDLAWVNVTTPAE